MQAIHTCHCLLNTYIYTPFIYLTNYQKQILFVALEEFTASEIRPEVKEKCQTLLDLINKNTTWK